jgi:hypothetical protein
MNASNPLRGVLSAWLSRAKLWWGISILAQILASLAGVMSIFVEKGSLYIAFAVGIVSALAAIGEWRSEVLRRAGDRLLRHFELEDSFGWPVDRKLLADSLFRAIPLSGRVRSRAREQGEFFASKSPAGPARAAENLSESAWWTQHLSGFMGRLMATVVAALVVGCLWSFLLAASALKSTAPLFVSNLLTSVIVLIFSAKLARLPIEYFQLSIAAREYDQKASDLLRAGSPTERDVLRLLADYQTERATAPLLPDWVWRFRRKTLNEIWASERRS